MQPRARSITLRKSSGKLAVGLRRDQGLRAPSRTLNSKMSLVAVTTSSLSSAVGRPLVTALGLRDFLVAFFVTPLVRGAVDGRKERTVGADGSLGRDEAAGLRAQRWPHIKSAFAPSSSD